MEFVGVLLIIGVATVLGHGLWLILAYLIREFAAAFGASPSSRSNPEPTFHCPGCRACRVRPDARVCPECGLRNPARLALNTQEAELDAALRQIRGFRVRGELDELTSERLETLLLERRLVLRSEKPAPAPPQPGESQPSEPAVPALPPAPVVSEGIQAGLPPQDAVPVPQDSLGVTPSMPPAQERLPPAAAVAPRRPRRRFVEVLGAFMEERNILWGELVGGLLVVGCSLALVLTLWRSLEQLPYFPFLLFTALTTALFGAGQYTLHNWKLTSTSRGLLIICLLLLPLNMLVLGDITAPRMEAVRVLGWVDPIVTLAAMALLTGLAHAAGRDLIAAELLPGPIDRRWLLAIAVIIVPAVPLVGARLLNVSAPGAFFLLALLTVLCQAGAASAVLAGLTGYGRRAEPWQLEARQTGGMLVFLGLGLFALIAGLSFLVAHAEDLALVRPLLAVPLILAGAPVLAGGMLIHQRLLQPALGGLRTTGTALALVGVLGITVGVLLAWPQPVALLAACTLAGLLLAAAGFLTTPWAHGGSLGCLSLAALLAFHLLTGRLPASPDDNANIWLASVLTSAASGAFLAVVALLLAGLTEGLIWVGRRRDAVHYAWSSAVLALLGLLAVTWHGPEQPLTAAAVHGLCVAGLLASNYRWRERGLAASAVWLVLFGTLWALWEFWPGQLDRWALVVAVETLAMVLLAAVLRFRATPLAQLGSACLGGSAGAGLLALALAVLTRSFPDQGTHPITAFALALAAFGGAGLTARFTLTWVGSVLVLAGLSHLCLRNITIGAFPLPLSVALAAHATLTLTAAVVLERWAGRRRLFSVPLRESAQLTAQLAAPLILFFGFDLPFAQAGVALWVSLLWLVLAFLERSPGWFTAFQAGLSAAVLFTVTAWLKRCDWIAESSLGLLDPRAFQAYMIGLGLLSLGWTLVRKAAQRRPLTAELYYFSWPGLDRLILGILVVGQLLLAVVWLGPTVAEELIQAGQTLPFKPPVELAYGHGTGAFLLLALLAAVLLTTLATTVEQGEKTVRGAAVLGLMLLLLTAPVLWAGIHANDLAAASALRWGLGCCFLIGSALVWFQTPLSRLASWLRLGPPPEWRSCGALGVLLGAVGVVVALTGAVAWLGFQGGKPSGPLEDSPFARMGWVISNVGPLVLLIVGLAGTAVRERSPRYAFGAGLLATATTTLGYALAIVTGGGGIHGVELVHMALLACLTASLCALGWLGCRRGVPDWPKVDPLLTLQVHFGLAGLVGLAALALAAVLIDPALPLDPAFGSLGNAGWLVLAVAFAVVLGYWGGTAPKVLIHLFGLTALVAGSFLACLARYRDAPGLWRSYHVVSAFCILLALTLVVGISCLPQLPARQPLLRWLKALALALLVLALRGAHQEPFTPLVGAGLALVAAILYTALGLWFRGPASAYSSGAALWLGGLIVWGVWGPFSFSSLFLTTAVCLALASACWTVIGFVQRARTEESEILPEPGFPFAHQAPLLALLLLILAFGPTMNLELGGAGKAPDLLDRAALCLVGLALGLTLWDRRAVFALPSLYVLGLTAEALLLRHPTLWANLTQASGIGLAMFVTLASILAWASSRRPEWFRPFALPPRSLEIVRVWFFPAQAAVACVIVLVSLNASATGESLALRLTGPAAILLLLPGTWLLAVLWTAGWAGSAARYAVLVLAALFLAEAASALPDPTGVAPRLQRSAWILAALTAATLVCGNWLSPRLKGAWGDATRRVSLYLACLGMVVALLMLMLEIPVFDPIAKRSPLSVPALAASLLALVTLAIVILPWAIIPDRDPLGLTPQGRSRYVYAAELLLLLTFIQLRLNVPKLFLGVLVQYWMLLVMLLAFIGIGLSELFHRRGLAVLGRPLLRTAVFLPLVPLLAFWARPPQAVVAYVHEHAPGLEPFLGYLLRIPAHLDAHALIWFLTSGLYALAAYSRRSFGWVLAAALSANFGVWALLGHAGIEFLVHPQVWLIPLALIVLVSEHLNRHRLSVEVGSSLRYLGLSMIYVASTADLFITGVGNSLWLPVVLAVLAVAGVLVGILLRVKAFLFLGVSFLVVDVFTMIWHAAVDRAHTWVWWASGVVLGLLILALFAVFEKRRNDVLRLVEEVRRWA
jgi:hypothetical protein